MNILQIITALMPFKVQLQKAADYYFSQGYPMTTFARSLNNNVQILASIDIPSEDDFYTMLTGNVEMRTVLNWLGYTPTVNGICMTALNTHVTDYNAIWDRCANITEDLKGRYADTDMAVILRAELVDLEIKLDLLKEFQ